MVSRCFCFIFGTYNEYFIILDFSCYKYVPNRERICFLRYGFWNVGGVQVGVKFVGGGEVGVAYHSAENLGIDAGLVALVMKVWRQS